MANPRKIALDVLLEIEQKGAYSNITLNHTFSRHELTSQDKALATAIIYGVLDRRITLDYVLSRFIKTPLKKVQPTTLTALRIALYQIVYMDKIPQSAAVNESVKLVKSSRERHNASFVNAVLRNILRQGITLPQGDDTKALSVRYSCPDWIINSFICDYGTENTISLLEASLGSPKVTLRVNTVKCREDELLEALAKEEITAQKSEFPFALTVEGNINIAESDCYKKGLFHVQDTASQTVAAKINPAPCERILDMCSAPGGKAFTMAQYMENQGELIACDIYEKRVELISKGAVRLGLDIIKPTVCDATVYNSALGLFDAVLCDVPCSGLGVIRRKPEIKYKQENDFNTLAEMQAKILENAALYVKSGGRILYSTCTLNKTENEQVTHAFLDKHSDYELKYEHTFMPHIDGTDGFYCALIQKSR